MKNQKTGIWLAPDKFVPIGSELTSTKEIATRLRYNGGYTDLHLPDPDIVLQKLGRGIDAYRELLPDAHMTSIIGSRKAGVKSLLWKIEGNNAPAQECDLIDAIFKSLKINDLIDEILDAPLFGYQPIEITWAAKNGWIIPEKIQGKPPEWFVFDNDNQLRFRSASSVIGDLLPPGKFLLATHGATYNNPYGKKLLSSCFWPVMFKKGGIKFWTQFVERFGGAFAIGKYPRGAQTNEIDELATMLTCLLQSAVAAVPDDASVEIIEAAGKSASGDMHKAYCDFFNAEMSKAIIGQTLTTEAGTNGSYSLGGVHANVRQDIIDSDAILVTDVFQQLIALTHLMNFSGDKMPKFKFWVEDGVDTTQAERDVKLTSTGQIRFSKKYFKKTYGLEDDDFDVIDGGVTGKQNRSPEPSEFREREPITRARDEADMLTDGLSPEQIQKEMSGILKPVIELIEQGSDYKQILEELTSTYDGMSSDALIELLERAFFVTEVWGRINGGRK